MCGRPIIDNLNVARENTIMDTVDECDTFGAVGDYPVEEWTGTGTEETGLFLPQMWKVVPRTVTGTESGMRVVRTSASDAAREDLLRR
jgi:hypothetical protein